MVWLVGQDNPARNGAMRAEQAYSGLQRIVHVIAGLDQAGAESVLCRLVLATKDRWETTVVSLTDEGYYGRTLREAGVTVECCNMPRGKLSLLGLFRLAQFLKRSHPVVVQTWMYHADFLGGVVARCVGLQPVLWCIRNFYLEGPSLGFSARLAARVCAWLSPFIPQTIICNSEMAAHVHEKFGYAPKKFLLIPNGYDFHQFRPDRMARERVRASWGVTEGEYLLGMVARWDPLKDHACLIAAIRSLVDRGKTVRLALIGPRMDDRNSALMALVSQNGLSSQVILAGPTTDVAAVMNALDIHVLSSIGEAFPNVVAEAMACGTPCVVTDVGDASAIVGDTGWVVPAADPDALCNAMDEALGCISGNREAMAQACRAHVLARFGLAEMATSYEDAWTNAIRDVR